MSLTLVYPDLKQISRRCSELGSSITCQYSYSQIHLHWTPPTPAQQRISRMALGVFVGVWTILGIYQQYYVLLCALALIGVVAWLRKRRKTVDLFELRLQNDVLIDTATRQILLQNVNRIYREQVVPERRVAFHEVQEVQVQSAGYAGTLYLTLTDTTKLYLLEIEADNLAQHMAQVLRKVVGVPQPARKGWWSF